MIPAPDMMHVDQPGPCGKFDSYERPEGLPVGMFPSAWQTHV